MKVYRCIHCGEPQTGLSRALAALQDEVAAERRRRAKAAERARRRYHSDPDYRARHLARVAAYKRRAAA